MNGIATLIEAGVLQADVPLGQFTTYRLGGPARYLADVPDRETLDVIISSGAAADSAVLILGRGSNLVIADEGFPGLVIRLGERFATADVDETGLEVAAGGAMPLPRLARTVVDHGLTGLEFFVGVPGSVGGAVRQNAGCFGVETADRLLRADVIDLRSGETRIASPGSLELSYRHSNVGPAELVVEATFQIDPGDTEAARLEMRRITRWRRDHQPGGTLNAGSVFKNPPHISAGELIDSLGLKGMSFGDVSISEKHANFFVAGSDASARDILALVEGVKDRVFELSGTMLEPEIQFVGFTE